MYQFNAADATKACIEWIRAFFEENGKGCNAVLGISGGKDSSVCAALLCAALGKERVIGVLMPEGERKQVYSLVKEPLSLSSFVKETNATK